MLKNKLAFAGGLVLAIGMIMLVSLPEKTASKVHVGVILPLTGQYASLGESDRNAMLMAKEDLAASNIELHFEDDAYDAKKAVSAYRQLRSVHDIDAVVVLSAPSIQALAPLTNADRIPLLGLGGTLVYEKDSVFQIMPSGDTLFVKLGQVYGDTYPYIAVAHSNAALFTLNANSFKKGLPPTVKIDDVALAPALDYRTEIQKILNKGPDAVTTFMAKEDAIRFLKALRTQDPKGTVRIICDFGTELAVNEYAAAIGQERLEGCLSTNLADTATQGFKERYQERFKAEPNLTGDYAYDSLGIIKGLSEAGPADTWINMLSSRDFEFDGYASGKIRFNEDGTRFDIAPDVHIYRNGRFEPMF
ncbi:MAG TPA: ABC transporter substrate-binding protein [Candidatus Paceibacterota bacterium]